MPIQFFRGFSYPELALKGKTVTLAADIDLGGHEFGGLVGVNDSGSLPYGFAGVFDGGGHTISNFICMERYYMGRPQAYIGFIPIMKEGAQIKNLVLDKVSVGSADTDYSSYGSQRAVVAGLTKGNNVIEKVTVSNSAVYGQSMLGAFVGEDASHGYALELNNCRITNTSVIGTERTALFIGYVYKECFPQITGCTYENSRCVFESYGTSRKSIKLDQYVEYQGQQVHINGDFILQSTNKYLYGTNAVYYNADWKRIPVTIDGVNWTVVYFPFNELP